MVGFLSHQFFDSVFSFSVNLFTSISWVASYSSIFFRIFPSVYLYGERSKFVKNTRKKSINHLDYLLEFNFFIVQWYITTSNMFVFGSVKRFEYEIGMKNRRHCENYLMLLTYELASLSILFESWIRLTLISAASVAWDCAFDDCSSSELLSLELL